MVENLYLPTTLEEIKALGWDQPDVIIVTGDSYIDSPFVGAAVIGRILTQAGFKTAIIGQPRVDSAEDITRLGEPRLFWGVTGGCIDSMVANYTSLKKRRRTDDYTPGGKNTQRPNRAVIAYTNLIQRYSKSDVPIVLGGLEASLRRIAHYDYWDDRIRRSIMLDAKADYLLFGMADESVIQLANALDRHNDPRMIKGLCYVSNQLVKFPSGFDFITLPSYSQVAHDKKAFTEMFRLYYENKDPVRATGLIQQYDHRYLIQNPPADSLAQDKLDEIYAMSFQRNQHPFYARRGQVKALETIRFSLQSHRGCYGECNFCAIALHEGRTVQWRSESSIIEEIKVIAEYPDFRGYIRDIGGPTANMYGFECAKKLTSGACVDKRCLFPTICPTLPVDHSKQISLLKKARGVPGVKKVFVASGIRYDMVMKDQRKGPTYLKEIVNHHVSGQLKIAPEHSEDNVLRLMGKPGTVSLMAFKQEFNRLSAEAGKQQYLTYYFIAAHPGCDESGMVALKKFVDKYLKINPEQVQIFLPAPSTWSAVMYYTGINPFTGEHVIVEKHPSGKSRQKNVVIEHSQRTKTVVSGKKNVNRLISRSKKYARKPVHAKDRTYDEK